MGRKFTYCESQWGGLGPEGRGWGFGSNEGQGGGLGA